MCFDPFAGDEDPHRRQESEEGRKSFQIPLVSWILLRQCVSPRAASGGGAWSNALLLFLQFQRASRHCS
jgi:hypothetical protein